MLDTIRRWLGATRRELELRADVDRLEADNVSWICRDLNAAKAHKAALAELREQLNRALAERNAARDDAREERLTLKIAACKLRGLADEIEPSIDPQDDRQQPAEEATP